MIRISALLLLVLSTSVAQAADRLITLSSKLDAITSFRIGGEQVSFPPAPKTTH